jgi:hypothetical protein
MCREIRLANGVVVICGEAKSRYCACGRAAVALCDWKIAVRKSGTCDKPICADHAKCVAPGKHLCPEHQRHYDSWKRRRGVPTQGNLFQEAA